MINHQRRVPWSYRWQLVAQEKMYSPTRGNASIIKQTRAPHTPFIRVQLCAKCTSKTDIVLQILVQYTDYRLGEEEVFHKQTRKKIKNKVRVEDSLKRNNKFGGKKKARRNSVNTSNTP